MAKLVAVRSNSFGWSPLSQYLFAISKNMYFREIHAFGHREKKFFRYVIHRK